MSPTDGRAARGALGAVLLALAGCSPALNWREARPEGSQARAMFPCKPASHARVVALGGASVEMAMHACSAGGTVYALSFADMQDPARVGAALDDLGRAVQQHLRGEQPATARPAAVAGMTPHPAAQEWRHAGALPDGRAMEERAALFSHGTRVYQATMLGPRLDDEAQEAFFGGLKVGP